MFARVVVVVGDDVDVGGDKSEWEGLLLLLGT